MFIYMKRYTNGRAANTFWSFSSILYPWSNMLYNLSIYIYDIYGQEIHHIVVIIMMNGMETVELIPSV